MSKSTYFANPEARAFLQRRVAVFGLIGAILGGTALAFRVVLGVLFGVLEEQVSQPGFIIHAVAVVPLLAVWLICRRGHLSVNTIHGIENAGIFLTSLCYIAMGLDIRPEVGADTITAFILALVMFAPIGDHGHVVDTHRGPRSPRVEGDSPIAQRGERHPKPRSIQSPP